MQFSIRLTKSFLKRSYARRMFCNSWKLAIAIVLIFVSFVLHGAILISDASSVFALSSIGFALLIFGAAWLRQSKMIDDWIRAQGDAPVVYVLSEESVESSSTMGSMRLKWDALYRITITNCDTLLHFQRLGALTLPTDQVPVEAMDYLKGRFRAHGKRVEDKRKGG